VKRTSKNTREFYASQFYLTHKQVGGANIT